jgi:hypothetical protein
MKSKEFRTFFGLGLIALGVLFLLQSFGVIETGMGLLWATLFAAGGATFLYFYWLNQEQWWALIPGFAMIGIGALISLAEYGPPELENVAGSIFMFSIALSFLIIYLRNREIWWPIIPLGFCTTLGIMILMEPFMGEGEFDAVILFLGGALTFGVLGFLPSSKGKMSWAFIPAAVMLVIGGIFLADELGSVQLFGAATLVIVGFFLLTRALRERGGI